MSKPKNRNVKKRGRCTTGEPKTMHKQLSLFQNKRTRNSVRLEWLFKYTSLLTFLFFTLLSVFLLFFVEIFRNKVYVPFFGSLYLATHKKHEMSIDSFVILKLLKEINFESNWWDRKLVIISPLTDGKRKRNGYWLSF